MKRTLPIFAIAGMSGLTACGYGPIVKHVPGKTYGDILVSPPRVSSRQRLVEDRLRQDAWLQKQLDAADSKEFGIQGFSDLRASTTTYIGLNAGADAAAGRLYQQQMGAQAQAADQAAQIEAIKAEIEKTRLNALLKAAQSETDPTKIASPYSDAGASTTPKVGTGATPPSADTSKAAEALGKVGDLGEAAAARDLPSAAAQLSNAKPSPLDEFRDRLALREEIRNEQIQNALDDRHDLSGNALYRLSFDATVVPASDSSAWAVIGVRMKRPGETGTAVALNAQDLKILELQLSKRWRERLTLAYARLLSGRTPAESWATMTLSDKALIGMARQEIDSAPPPAQSASPLSRSTDGGPAQTAPPKGSGAAADTAAALAIGSFSRGLIEQTNAILSRQLPNFAKRETSILPLADGARLAVLDVAAARALCNRFQKVNPSGAGNLPIKVPLGRDTHPLGNLPQRFSGCVDQGGAIRL